MIETPDRPEFDDYPHCRVVLAEAADIVGVDVADAGNTRMRLHGASIARQAAMRFYREAFPGTFTTADVARFFGCSKDAARRACKTQRADVLAVVDQLLTLESLR